MIIEKVMLDILCEEGLFAIMVEKARFVEAESWLRARLGNPGWAALAPTVCASGKHSFRVTRSVSREKAKDGRGRLRESRKVCFLPSGCRIVKRHERTLCGKYENKEIAFLFCLARLASLHRARETVPLGGGTRTR